MKNIEVKLIIYFIIVMSSLAILMLITHFIFIDRIKFWRLIYPIQGEIAIWNIHCSSNAPVWMKDSLKFIIKNQKNLSNQIAYIDTKNQVYTCQSGWQGTTFFSSNLNENTRFRYASLTKLVTSDAVLQQVNQGKINLDTPFISLFPELKKETFKDSRIQQISIENLLEHRSGFDRMRSEDVVFSLTKKSWCPYNLIELSKLKLDFEPDQRYAYDNRNYCLLGAVLERVGKQDYRKYIQQHYLINKKNIKFVDGYYYPDEVKYDFRNNDFWMESDDNRFDFAALSSSAGLSGSAKQLALLMNKMLSSEPYNILSIQPNTLTHCNIEKFKSCNGYAMWQYRASSDHPVMYFRNGGLPAVTSLAIVTEKNEVVVWLGNGASLYNEEYDENLLEKYFYMVLNN